MSNDSIPILQPGNMSSDSGNSTGASIAYQDGDIAWMLSSSALVWIMCPGVGLFYSGLIKAKNALSLVMLSLSAAAMVSIQWLLVGYSLAFSSTGNIFIGNIDKALYFNVLDLPSPGSTKIPDLMFSIYQAMFAMVTPALIIGAGAGRARFFPLVIFLTLWTTVVYDIIAYWVWNPNGWANKLGSLDFAGGSVVHIASGSAALALAIVLGKRKDATEDTPEAVQNVMVGTVLIWFGWYGFNGGSALASGMRAIMAFVVTNMAASAGAITATLLEYRQTNKFSPVAFCSGAIIGLVAITPGSGFVGPLASLVFGTTAAFVCGILMSLKHYVDVDDAADVFIVHGLAGLIGNILTGIFAEKRIASLDSTVIEGGWVDSNWMQVPYQLAGSGAAMAWSFTISLVLLKIIDKIPGLKLRADTESEDEGLDKAELGVTILPISY